MYDVFLGKQPTNNPHRTHLQDHYKVVTLPSFATNKLLDLFTRPTKEETTHHARIHAYTRPNTHTHTHAHTHARTRAHIRTPQTHEHTQALLHQYHHTMTKNKLQEQIARSLEYIH